MKSKKNINLDNLSDEEIMDEVARRTKLKAERLKPKPLDDIDWESVKELAIEAVDTLHKEGYPPKDCDHWFFEEVMTTVFGDDIWKWWNEKVG